MLAPGGEMEHSSQLTSMALCSLAAYPTYVEELRQASEVAIDYRRCGAVELALSEREAEELEARAARQAAIGIRSEPARHDRSVAARFYPDDALVNPRDVIAALRIVCLRLGVSIHEYEPVLEVFDDGSGLRTNQAIYRGDGVLIAAGAWSSALLPNLPKTTPVRGHLIAYDAAQDTLSTILRHRDTYLLQRGHGCLIAGTSTEHVGFDRTIGEGIVGEIHRRASQLLPALASMQPRERWVGFRPGIEGGLPAIGQVDGARIWTAFGHYRNGILLAPDTARRVEELITATDRQR